MLLWLEPKCVLSGSALDTSDEPWVIKYRVPVLEGGFSRTIVRGNDTDICIILLAYLPTLLQCNSDYKLLFDCGLLFVYSLSGYDFTSSFFGVGKLKFFDLFTSNTLTEDDLKVFKDISSGPEMMTDEQFRRVVKFTLAAYQSKGAATCDLHTARMKGILSPQVDSFLEAHSTIIHWDLRTSQATCGAKQISLLQGYQPLWIGGGKKFLTWKILMPFSFLHGLVDNVWHFWCVWEAVENLHCSCLNRNCSCMCSGTRCLPTCKCRGECRKDSKDQAGASEVVDQEVEAVNLMRVINKQLQISLDVNIVTLFY